jgi:superfamily I DNA/RNA helicase
MNNFELILGPPGTGKTTTLLNIVDDYLKKKTPPDRIGFVSFTKKAVGEAVTRATTRFNLSKRQLSYFRTLHSLAFYQLGLRTSEVMQWSHYKDLGKELGMNITGSSRQDLMTYELSVGDQAIFIESISRLTCCDLRPTWENQDHDVSWLELMYVKTGLDKFKRAHLLVDYTDMLVRYFNEGVIPSLDVLIVDEVQDLCLLQWRILERVANNCRVILAGDDDQAIFRWSGAAVDYFLNLANTLSSVTVLNQSYRVPKNIKDTADDVIKMVTDRRVKKYKPTTEAGSVEWVSSIEEVDLSSGSWLVLVRNLYLINPIIEYVRLCGFLYVGPYGDVREAPGARAALAWEKLCTTGFIDKTERFYVDKYLQKKLPSNLENIDPDKLKLHWYDVLQLPPDEREFYRAARRGSESFLKPPRITISTIHGAKGGECDNVLLLLDMSNKTYEGYLRRPGDEARVFYVAVTRARRRLVVVSPQTNNYFNLGVNI